MSPGRPGPTACGLMPLGPGSRVARRLTLGDGCRLCPRPKACLGSPALRPAVASALDSRSGFLIHAVFTHISARCGGFRFGPQITRTFSPTHSAMPLENDFPKSNKNAPGAANQSLAGICLTLLSQSIIGPSPQRSSARMAGISATTLGLGDARRPARQHGR